MSQEALLDKAVLEYLDRRGLRETSQRLRAESTNLQPMTMQGARNPSGGMSDVMFYVSGEGQPSHYGKSFDALADWVDHCLDMYRHELAQLLYPVFIHCCLKLVAGKASNEATQLIARHSTRFTHVGGQPSKVRMQELNELQAVSLPEHLVSSRLAQAVKARIPVTLCKYSHEVLMHHLQSCRLYLLLGIINDHLKLKRVEGLPRDASEAAEEISLLSGQIQQGATGANLKELNLNLLKDSAEDKVAIADATEKAEAVIDEDEYGKPLTKKEKTALKRTAEKAVEAAIATEGERMTAEIPLPRVSQRMMAGSIEDIRARAELSSDALPSAAFFTFVNTHHTLNCCTFANDCTLVAGGFEDASVRLYHVDRSSAASPDDTPGTELTELVGHSGPVYGLDFSHDASLLFSASADGTLRLWHLELAACLNMYRGHNYPVWDVAASPHGQYFASAGADRSARIWTVERNQPLRILAGHYSDVEVARWHPNAHFLATGSSDHSVRLWDVRTGEASRILIGHKSPVTALAFHPGGSLLTSADDEGGMITWNLAEARKVATAKQHKGPVWSLSYSAGTGDLLASGGADNSVRLWGAPAQAAEETELPLAKSFFTKSTPVCCTQFTPRNLLMAAGALTLSRKQKH